jgi:DNA-binding Lrp family transcriptional regulator
MVGFRACDVLGRSGYGDRAVWDTGYGASVRTGRRDAAEIHHKRLSAPKFVRGVRLSHPNGTTSRSNEVVNGNNKPFHDLVAATPEILEAHHVTGDDCFVIKVVARSMRHPQEVSGKICALGSVTTSVVHSSPLPRRPLGR